METKSRTQADSYSCDQQKKRHQTDTNIFSKAASEVEAKGMGQKVNGLKKANPVVENKMNIR